jgi:hypothetical protein
MGTVIGALLAVIVGLFIIFSTVGLLLDILGVVIVIVGVGLLIQYLRGRRGTRV